MIQVRTRGRQAQSGLTLIEMLVVLVILGVTTTAAVLSVNMVGRDRRAENEAVRLAARLTLAVDEGLISRTALALFWTPGGYQIRRWGADGWQEAATPMLARAHALPSAVVLRRLDGSADPVVVAEDGLGPAVAMEVRGAGTPWIVAFDGFSAHARAEGAP